MGRRGFACILGVLVSFYKVDVDGVQYLVGQVFPAGQLLNDEVSAMRDGSARAVLAAGSFRFAAARLATVLDAAPEVARRMSAFTGESVAGVQSMLAAFLQGDDEMAKSTARSNSGVSPDEGSPFNAARFSSARGMQ